MGGNRKLHRPPADGALPKAARRIPHRADGDRPGFAGKFGKNFAALDAQQQTELLQSLTDGGRRFFSTVIAHTMQGYYGDPRHGGNRDAVSWRMLGVPVIPIRGRNRYEFPKQGA